MPAKGSRAKRRGSSVATTLKKPRVVCGVQTGAHLCPGCAQETGLILRFEIDRASVLVINAVHVRKRQKVANPLP